MSTSSQATSANSGSNPTTSTTSEITSDASALAMPTSSQAPHAEAATTVPTNAITSEITPTVNNLTMPTPSRAQDEHTEAAPSPTISTINEIASYLSGLLHVVKDSRTKHRTAVVDYTDEVHRQIRADPEAFAENGKWFLEEMRDPDMSNWSERVVPPMSEVEYTPSDCKQLLEAIKFMSRVMMAEMPSEAGTRAEREEAYACLAEVNVKAWSLAHSLDW